MKNENSQNTNQTDGEKKDEIPLWLQGLQDHENEDTNPIEVEASYVENWGNELTQETSDGESSSGEGPFDTAKGSKNEETIPDWLSEIAKEESEMPSEEVQGEMPIPSPDEERNDSLAKEEGPQEVQLEAHSESLSDEVDEPVEQQIEAEKDYQYPEHDASEENEEDQTPKEQAIELSTPAENEDISKDSSMINEEILNGKPFGAEMSDDSPNSGVEDYSQEDNLPLWLQEMIAEPEEPEDLPPLEVENRIEEFPEKEPTKPIQLSGEPPQEEAPQSYEEEFHELETEPASKKESEIISEVGEFDVGDSNEYPEPSEWVPEKSIEEDESPQEQPPSYETSEQDIMSETQKDEIIQETPKENFEELAVSPEDTNIEEPEQIEELPESLPDELQKAKDLLSEGEIDQALDILHTSNEISKFKQEIKSWLDEASQAIDNPSADFWEFFGDIAMEDDQHEQALNAYTNAIQSLLSNKKE